MSATLDIYVTLRSPYSYLATGRIVALAAESAVPVIFRPVYPIAIKTPDFFEKSDPLWLSYFVLDIARVAQMEGIPFVRPDPDPIVQDLATGKLAREQPFIRRITRLAQAAADQGAGLAFYAEVGKLIFGGTKDWHQGAHLSEAAQAVGLDLAELDALIAADPDAYDAKLAANYEAQREAGHWGTPLLVFDGEPFFGQDRVAMCRWRMAERPGALLPA
ncbi:MAG: DsbA family protein [Pseudomonadota bacterium]